MVKLVKVIENKPGRTTYEADDGKTYTLIGDLSTRGNNPGNISPSKKGQQFWIDKFGAIGFAPSSKGQPDVALFPDIESGRRAQAYLWQTKMYKDKTLKQAADSWATDSYADELIEATGATADTLVSDLTPEQMQIIFDKQTEIEGSKKLKVLDDAGDPVDPEIAKQFGPSGAIRLPGADIPNGSSTGVATLTDIGESLFEIGKSSAKGVIPPPLPRARPKVAPTPMPGRPAGVGGRSLLPAFSDASDDASFGIDLGNQTSESKAASMAAQMETQATDVRDNGGWGDGLASAVSAEGDKILATIANKVDSTTAKAVDSKKLASNAKSWSALPTLSVNDGDVAVTGFGDAGSYAKGAVKLVAPKPITEAIQPHPRPASTQTKPATAASAPTPKSVPKMVKLASGKMIAVGTYPSSGGHGSTVIEDDGKGGAKITHVRPGLMGEADKPTIVGGIIRSKMAEIIPAAAKTAVEAVTTAGGDAIKSGVDTLGNAANQLGAFFQNITGNGAPAVVPPTVTPSKVTPVKATPKLITQPSAADIRAEQNASRVVTPPASTAVRAPTVDDTRTEQNAARTQLSPAAAALVSTGAAKLPTLSLDIAGAAAATATTLDAAANQRKAIDTAAVVAAPTVVPPTVIQPRTKAKSSISAPAPQQLTPFQKREKQISEWNAKGLNDFGMLS